MVRKALQRAYIAGEHRGWCAGWEACRMQMAEEMQARIDEAFAAGLAAKSDGLTEAGSSDTDEQMEEPPQGNGGGLDVALNIVSFLAPLHVEVPMQAERSL